MRQGTGLALLVSGATAISLAAGLLAYELLLRLDPWRIPESYRQTLPLDGVDLLNPGVLANTPIQGVPLPVRRRSYDGPPLSDLERLGMLRPDDNPDPREFPRVRIEVDELGLPNRRGLDRADLVLVGDSYAVHAGLLEPEGLALRLERATGLGVYNLGVTGLGPVREAWLLGQLGLPRRPRAVVWLFFGGNDVQNTATLIRVMRSGASSYADRHPDYRRPRSWALAVLGHALAGSPPAARADRPHGPPLPPLRLETADGSILPVWFYPGALRALAYDEAHWRAHPAWETVKRTLRSARRQARAAGAGMLVVYLPSKAQLYLETVEQGAREVFAMATYQAPLPRLGPRQFLRAARENGGSLERLLAEFCADARIDFLSATPHLRRLLARGVAPFYAADSHWNAHGQAVLVEPIAAALRNLH